MRCAQIVIGSDSLVRATCYPHRWLGPPRATIREAWTDADDHEAHKGVTKLPGTAGGCSRRGDLA
jgi:hypothetical protein